MSLQDGLRERVKRWLTDDPDPVCRTELTDLLARADDAALQERFSGTLLFGTAGLRGELGAGPNRMNRAVVARATAGLCAHLIRSDKTAQQRGICIGFDARHMSREFCEETAAVAAGAGFKVHVFESSVPTPVLAFAVLACKAAGGVMVTASHNPARDNGYKVYWENGAQIIPPHDLAIAADMQAVPSVLALPRVGRSERRERGIELVLGADMERRYLAGVSALTLGVCEDAGALRIVYTAMHGVGDRLARAALLQAGFANVWSVAEQAAPDPDFPTVAFPNPEEPGAMDRALALGEQMNADLVIANDPDADRLALGARDHDGKLRMLTGNQVGLLLGEHLLASDPGTGERAVLTSIVSSPMIASIARAHGALWEPTLTGFKWICCRALELQAERGVRFVFGFEEALGYCPGTLVRDKDGISSAVVAARLAAESKRDGFTLWQRLDALYRQHGVYLSGQISIRLQGESGLQRREALMANARAQPPSALAGHRVTATLDLLDATTRGTPSFELRLPKSDVLCFELEGGHRVMIRPSGTEPKLKIYLDVREAVHADEPTAAAQRRAQATLDALATELRERF